jgi:hypothetical protein
VVERRKNALAARKHRLNAQSLENLDSLNRAENPSNDDGFHITFERRASV